MRLEEVIDNERGLTRFNVSPPEFTRLKEDALARASDWGYEVVVIDFADPGNIYRDIDRRFDELPKYEGKRVLWFHENVEGSGEESLGPARSHAQFSGHR